MAARRRFHKAAEFGAMTPRVDDFYSMSRPSFSARPAKPRSSDTQTGSGNSCIGLEPMGARERWDSSSIATSWRFRFPFPDRRDRVARNVERLAARLGARVAGRTPDVGGGAFGAARMARVFESIRRRLEPAQGKRAGRPTDAAWVRHPKVPMSAATERKLTQLAERASSNGRRVSPMQMAAQLLEDVVTQIPTD